MIDPEACLNAPEYTYYVDSVKSCSTPDGTFIEASSATYQIGFTDAFSPSPYTSSSSGPLVFQPSGLYWKVTVHAKVRIGEVSAEDPDVVNYHVGTTPPVTLTVSSTFMTLDSITVISGAVQTNVIQGTFPNWACVKSATGTVIVEATTGPNNDSTEWANINWGNDGGSPVPDQARRWNRCSRRATGRTPRR